MSLVAQRVRRLVVASVAAAYPVIAARDAVAEDPPPGPPPVVGRQTAQAYDEFAEWARRASEQAVQRMAGRYDLDEDHRKVAREAIERARDGFLREHGQKAFDLYQRGKALGEMMREQRMGWQEVPVEVRQDLARRVLPLMDEMEKQLTAVGAAIGQTLTDQQRERLVEDQLRMQRGLAMARTQIRLTSGVWTDAQTRPSGLAAAPAPVAAVNLDAWERYVRRFIQRHRLDEVQKLKATDLLAEYRARAEKLKIAPPTVPQPTTAPTTAPTTSPADPLATPADFQARLDEIRARRRPFDELFEQLRGELETIPTEVQRKLAEEDSAPSRRTGARDGRTED